MDVLRALVSGQDRADPIQIDPLIQFVDLREPDLIHVLEIANEREEIPCDGPVRPTPGRTALEPGVST